MTCFSYFSTLLGVTIYVHRWYGHRTRCACDTRSLKFSTERNSSVIDSA